MITKCCPICKQDLLLKEFHKNKTKKHGVAAYCRQCSNLYNKGWRSNPKRKLIIKNYDLKRTHGITLEEFELKAKLQRYGCAICKKIEKVKWCRGWLSVDHNHKTGKIRGLLCHACNTSLGKFEENISTLKRAIVYLNLWR